MEININSNGFGNVGMGRVLPDTTGIGAERGKIDTSRASRPAALHVSGLETQPRSVALVDAEPVADVPESALSRDDALGRLMNAAFNLQAPPMPAFAD